MGRLLAARRQADEDAVCGIVKHDDPTPAAGDRSSDCYLHQHPHHALGLRGADLPHLLPVLGASDRVDHPAPAHSSRLVLATHVGDWQSPARELVISGNRGMGLAVSCCLGFLSSGVAVEHVWLPGPSLERKNARYLGHGRQTLMNRPRLLLLDEPALGLAPPVVRAIFNALEQLRRASLGILLAEQDVDRGLEQSDRTYVIDKGCVALSGRSEELKGDSRVEAIVAGLASAR